MNKNEVFRPIAEIPHTGVWPEQDGRMSYMFHVEGFRERRIIFDRDSNRAHFDMLVRARIAQELREEKYGNPRDDRVVPAWFYPYAESIGCPIPQSDAPVT